MTEVSKEFFNLTLNEKQKMINDVSLLSESQQIEVFNILELHNEIKYTENKNGIFININDIPDSTINEIIKYIDYCNQSNKILEKNEDVMLHPPEPSNNANLHSNILNKSISKIVNTEVLNENEEETSRIKKTIEKVSEEMGLNSNSEESDEDINSNIDSD